MFASLKRTLILATILIFPGMAMAYTTVDEVIVADPVLDGGTTVPVVIQATVHTKDWKSTLIDWHDSDLLAEDICINHADVAGTPTGSTEAEIQEILMLNNAVFDEVSGDGFDVETYDNDTCSNSPTTWNDPSGRVDIILRFSHEPGPVELTNFLVTKEFIGHDVLDTVEISIVCNDGHVHPDTAPIGDDGIHNFVVENLHPSNENVHCTVKETTQVSGFETYYVYGNDDPGDNNQSGCVWSGNGNLSIPLNPNAPRNTNVCRIYNIPLPATFTVTKKWEIFNDADLDGKGEGTVRDSVRIHINCDNKIMSGVASDDDGMRPLYLHNGPPKPGDILSFGGGNGGVDVRLNGDGYVAVEVLTTPGNATCYASESYRNSAVEQTEDTCYVAGGGISKGPGRRDPGLGHEMGPGGSATCGFTNTIFFEGIPTLSQYGMAIMALLMLGLGFVGFRRFV